MAAIDPTAPAENGQAGSSKIAFLGSTLKIIHVPEEDDEDSDEDDDSFDMAQLLDDDSDERSDNEAVNGVGSSSSNSTKAQRKAALLDAIAKAEAEDDDDDDEDGAPQLHSGKSLTAKQKGKAKALDMDEEMDESDEDSDLDDVGAEEVVICTLDPSKQYQQPLDITINEHETVYFRTSGTHTIYLTGNVLVPDSADDDDGDMYDSDEEDEGFDLPPGEDELDLYGSEDESDELDEMEDPRVTELDSDEGDGEPAPKLIKTKQNAIVKGKNKRAAEDSSDVDMTDSKPTVDSLLDKALKPADAGAPNGDEKQLSKNQIKKMRKKMKDNSGNAVETVAEDQGVKAETTPKSDKKVQFAKTLVQGPSGSSQPNGDVAKAKTETKTVASPQVNGNGPPPKTSTGKGPRVVSGVTIDDKKLGSGPAAKKGDKVSMRYIGKLEKDKKVFDSNKKGPPFKFSLGSGEVIKGWDIGVAGMTVGGERRITVPAHLGYGSKGDSTIPANSTLVFDVKLLEIK